MAVLDKSQFMKKVINDYYSKRFKKKRSEADSFIIERAIAQKAKADRSKGKGVLKYEY